jgi:hypothetical protein
VPGPAQRDDPTAPVPALHGCEIVHETALDPSDVVKGDAPVGERTHHSSSIGAASEKTKAYVHRRPTQPETRRPVRDLNKPSSTMPTACAMKKSWVRPTDSVARSCPGRSRVA